jgi:hypothetical protein
MMRATSATAALALLLLAASASALDCAVNSAQPIAPNTVNSEGVNNVTCPSLEDGVGCLATCAAAKTWCEDLTMTLAWCHAAGPGELTEVNSEDFGFECTGATAPCTGNVAVNVCAQPTVDLGLAANFSVLAGSAITTTGLLASNVTGDLGVYPLAAHTGFTDEAAEFIHTPLTGDPAGEIAKDGKADLLIAYNDAAGRKVSDECVAEYGNRHLVAGNLGLLLMITPGLYQSSSSLDITSGILILDAQHDTEAVFIFQMASTLESNLGHVELINGAKAENIFWQVGSSATLGEFTTLEGTVMAYASISVGEEATVDGRLLAGEGAVTLTSAVITKP